MTVPSLPFPSLPFPSLHSLSFPSLPFPSFPFFPFIPYFPSLSLHSLLSFPFPSFLTFLPFPFIPFLSLPLSFPLCSLFALLKVVNQLQYIISRFGLTWLGLVWRFDLARLGSVWPGLTWLNLVWFCSTALCVVYHHALNRSNCFLNQPSQIRALFLFLNNIQLWLDLRVFWRKQRTAVLIR